MFDQQNLMELNSCLACGSDKLKLTLDLGNQPLANSYKNTKDGQQPEYPLAINRCTECYHVQLTHAVNPDLLFKNYLYVSGTSTTMIDHFKWFADHVLESYTAYSNALAFPTRVLDIGCNDCSQLDQFDDYIKTYGIDPAENLCKTPKNPKHDVTVGYFDEASARDLAKKTNDGHFDAIIAQNVFAHNYDPIGFLRAAGELMGSNSLMFIQTSQADMIKNGEFDTIYHEHISFYNIKSMDALCSRAGLYLVDVAKCPIHGNSYVFTITKNATRSRPAHISNLMYMEELAGLTSEKTYIDYAKKCAEIKSKLIDTVFRFYSKGHTVVGYGAAAKGMTLLNYTGIKLDFIVDDNPLKQGKFTPGSSIEICSSEELKGLSKEVVFVPLAWNFFEEIKRKIKATRPENSKDVFVLYFPEVKVVE